MRLKTQKAAFYHAMQLSASSKFKLHEKVMTPVVKLARVVLAKIMKPVWSPSCRPKTSWDDTELVEIKLTERRQKHARSTEHFVLQQKSLVSSCWQHDITEANKNM